MTVAVEQIEADPALLQAARDAWPEMRENELTAAHKRETATSGHEWRAALADELDARVTYLVYYALLLESQP